MIVAKAIVKGAVLMRHRQARKQEQVVPSQKWSRRTPKSIPWFDEKQSLAPLNPPRKVDCTWELVCIPIFRVPTMVHESMQDSPGFDDILQPEHHNHTAAFNSDAIISI
mmetsp:Transcript_17097/g.34194  ORF Transcript_17097/g.34194 Transcript_17097/m.34194 type:complete len:109 (-) Transcript_17097:9-335(-)